VREIPIAAAMCACRQPARCLATISFRPWTVVRALPWATRTSEWMWAFDKPHPTRRFSFVQAGPPVTNVLTRYI
jgi:hypothetical protein